MKRKKIIKEIKIVREAVMNRQLKDAKEGKEMNGNLLCIGGTLEYVLSLLKEGKHETRNDVHRQVD